MICPHCGKQFEQLIKVGDVFYGYCNGYFGDLYGKKVVLAYGNDWITVRDLSENVVSTAQLMGGSLNTEDNKKMIKNWKGE